MKRKLLPLVLALALCVSLLPAALAEGKAETAFSDVPAGSWYESGIKLCAEKGIMIGMGDGTFAPDKPLTAAECLTLALRLYDLCHGGKGVIEKAPENWDQITITAADGTAVTGRPGQPFQYQGKGAKGLDTEGVWFAVQAGQEALAQELSGMAATVTIHGKDYPATLSYSTRSYIDGTSENILFAAYTGDDSSIHHAFAVTTNNYWWADSAAMVQKLGLYDWASEESNGFRDLYVAAASGLEATARRAHFADSLATAAGTLPVLQEKVTIPDLGIPEQGVAPAYENILMLYRAGVLNGKDASGSFDYYGQLTRAEAATMVARVLDPTLRIGAGTAPTQPSEGSTTTAEAEVEVNRNLEKPFTTYAAAVEKLRSGMGYSNERTFDTDTCTIFCYDLGGFMNAPLDYLRVVYKAGGAYPEGTILDLPFTTDRGWHVNTRTDSMALSDDKKNFTYTYTFEEMGRYGNPIQAGGTYTYVFDVPSGTVTLTQPVLRTVTYAQALEQVTQEEGFTVEKIVQGAGVTAVLRYSLLEERNNAKSYNIFLVYRSGGLRKEGTVNIEQPPFTAVDGFYTDRAPDHMFFSKDGRSFFCTYYYAPHDGSPYTSILDLEQGYHSSGHLPTVVELLSAGATVDKRVDGPAATALLVYDEHDGAKDYILYLINKETGGAWPVLLPSTYVGAADDGSVYYPTDRAPDSISFSADGSILTYVYKFAQALKRDGAVYHEAGTYTYKVNVTTGELSVAHT